MTDAITVQSSQYTETSQPVPGLRWVKRWIVHEHMGNKTNVPTAVLQQQEAVTRVYSETGRGECFVRWVDVPEVDE